MNKRLRKHMYSFYLSDDEALIFDEKLKKAGNISRSDFLRQLILYGCIYEVDLSPINQYEHQLSAIGNNINQIAHKVNSDIPFTPYDFDILKERLDEIWQLQRSMRSLEPLINR